MAYPERFAAMKGTVSKELRTIMGNKDGRKQLREFLASKKQQTTIRVGEINYTIYRGQERSIMDAHYDWQARNGKLLIVIVGGVAVLLMLVLALIGG